MTNNSTLAQQSTLDTVQRLFAEATRYPLELLTTNADLEEDLGIDSVKLGEILAVLRERFELESRLTDDIKEIRTIATIANLLEARLGLSQATILAAQPIVVQLPAPGNPPDLLAQVTDVIEEVTRYPRELLTPNADLEEDLGIDSVKLGEMLAVLRERFGLESRLTDDIKEIRTIAIIANLLEARLGQAQTAILATLPSAVQSPVVSNQMNLLDQVTDVIEEVTRYPRELLTPNVDLEEDLGVDSVKLGEMLAVLRERFGLENGLTDDIKEIRTIAIIADLLEARLGQTQPAVLATQPITVQLPVVSNQMNLLDQVTRVIEEVTRYPRELLTPNADLEEDLGIDSVKLGEMLAVLRERFGLENRLTDDIKEIRTIATIANLLEARLGQPQTNTVDAPLLSAGIIRGATQSGSFLPLEG